MKSLRLIPDLIPQTSFFKNLRLLLGANEWNTVRRACYKKADYKCEVCGVSGQKHCHEVWEYDAATGIQKLVRLQALCPDCHEVKHIGLAQIRGRYYEALAHMIKVNGINEKRALEAIAEAFRVWKTRSQRSWTLDVSLLETMK